MGGSAFSSGDAPLRTPRMPPRVYHAEKQRCQHLLRGLYVHVDSPIDGPAKTDFGDVDIFVCERRPDAPPLPGDSPPSVPELMREIASLLDAHRSIIVASGASSSNMAILWPKDDGDDTPASTEASGGQGTPRYIQVDIRISPTLESHRWMLFKHAHGDIWNVVGSLIRPYGLTVDDTGMWIRDPEIEAISKTRAKVHLTSDPDRVLAFLGLPFEPGTPHARIWVDEPFASLEDMFEYTTHCRMMYVAPTASEHPGHDHDHDEGHHNLKDIQSLRHNDRKRIQHRPGFKRWIDEFIPKCRREGRFAVKTTSRARVTDEALDAFSSARDEFARRRRAFLLDRQRDHVWNGIIKTMIPELPHSQGGPEQLAVTARACLVKALKRIILERDESYGVAFDEAMVDRDGFYDEDRVRAFIQAHKDEVRQVAIARQHAAYLENVERKKAKKSAKRAEEDEQGESGSMISTGAAGRERMISGRQDEGPGVYERQ